jgi:hypothetical protein
MDAFARRWFVILYPATLVLAAVAAAAIGFTLAEAAGPPVCHLSAPGIRL